MISNKQNKAVAGLMVGLSVFGSLLVTSALAGPPKKATKKPPAKTAKKDDPAAIAAGKKVYDANGCAGCHAIGETGGKAGPELTKVGADPKHTSEWLAKAVVNNKSVHPDSTMPPYDQIKGKDLTNIVAYMASLKGTPK